MPTLFELDDGAPPLVIDGHCPRCKVQLMWTRKRLNMGTRIFFETCPKCLPDNIKLQSPNEATLQIASLQQSLEALTSTALNMSRDIRRLQTELQFLMMDIEESGSTSHVDTDTFEHLVNKLAASLEEKVHLMMDSSRDEPPSVLEQVKELHADLLKQLKRQQEGAIKTESASIYALVDVLKQLDQTIDDVESQTFSLQEDELPDFRDEVDTLRVDLENTKHVLEDIPNASRLSRDVSTLSDRYLLLLQDVNRKSNASDDESRGLQKKMEELERQHAAEVEALRALLNAFMTTTVAANVVAVDSVACVADDGGNGNHARSPQEPTSRNSLPAPPVAQAEVVGPLTMNRHYSTATVVAEPVIPVANPATPRDSTLRNSDTRATPQRLGGLANVPETPNVVSPDSSNNRSSIRPNAEISVGYHSATLLCHPPLIDSETIAYENLCRLENVTDPWTDILHVMKDHPSSPLIQACALEKLACLTRELMPSSSIEQRHLKENRRKIGGAGGIDLILKAIRQFPRHEDVQRYGLRTIGTASRRHKENAVKFGNNGAIELVLGGMRQFPNNVDIQRNGVFTLGILAFNVIHHKTKIRDLDGIALILSTMQKFPNDVQIQRNGLSCLANLISNNAENQSLIREMGGVDIILSTMKSFPKDVMVQDRACLTISFLAQSTCGQKELRRKGSIIAVRKAMSVIGNQSKSGSNALRGLKSRTREP